MRGGERILGWLERELGIAVGVTTPDSRFTLETVRCLGCCSLSPVIRVDGDTYSRPRRRDIPEVLRQCE